MVQAKLQEIFGLKKKVEKQEDNTLRGVKYSFLFALTWLSISCKSFKYYKIKNLLEMLSKPQ